MVAVTGFTHAEDPSQYVTRAQTLTLQTSAGSTMYVGPDRTLKVGIPYGPGIFVGFSIAVSAGQPGRRLILLGTYVETDAGGQSFLYYTLRNPENVAVDFYRTSIVVYR